MESKTKVYRDIFKKTASAIRQNSSVGSSMSSKIKAKRNSINRNSSVKNFVDNRIPPIIKKG